MTSSGVHCSHLTFAKELSSFGKLINFTAMQHGICLLSFIAGRKEPAVASEMTTQLVFGECYTVLEMAQGWMKIRGAFDDYECWISNTQFFKLSAGSFQKLKQQTPVYTNSVLSDIVNKHTQQALKIPLGSVLPFFDNGACIFDQYHFEFTGSSNKVNSKLSADNIINLAREFLNTPYLWGGKTPFGADCSGFVQTVFKLSGYQLPRDASVQVEKGFPLSFVEEAEAGDLAFFDNEEGQIIHVGILLNNHQIIHASGWVKIERFDHYGIYSDDQKKYTHMLRVIKRVV